MMRWRRSMLVVSTSSRRAFLAAGLAADGPGGYHPAESVREDAVATDARTATALSAFFRVVEGLGVRNTEDGEEEGQKGAGNVAMAAAGTSIPCPAAAGFRC
nr:unnamed protein product [Digitaria exilis]